MTKLENVTSCWLNFQIDMTRFWIQVGQVGWVEWRDWRARKRGSVQKIVQFLFHWIKFAKFSFKSWKFGQKNLDEKTSANKIINYIFFLPASPPVSWTRNSSSRPSSSAENRNRTVSTSSKLLKKKFKTMSPKLHKSLPNKLFLLKCRSKMFFN